MKTISILLMAFMAVTCCAQSFTYPCQSLINNGKYPSAADKIRDELKSRPDDVEYLLASAVLYSRVDYKRHNSEKAYKAAVNALDAMSKSDEKTLSKLAKKGVSQTSVYQFLNQLKDEYFVTLLDDGKNTVTQMEKYIKQMKKAPEEHRAYIQLKLDSIYAQQAMDAARKKFVRDSLIFASFDNADAHKNIHRMISMYGEYSVLKDSMRALMAIHSYYADYGDDAAFAMFYRQFDCPKLHEPYYPDGQSVAQHDSLLCLLFKNRNYDVHSMTLYIRESAPSLNAIWCLQQLIKPYVEQRNWKEAFSSAIAFAPFFGNDKRFADLISTLSADANPDVKSHIIDMLATDELNSHYSPKISADNKHLYFCGSDVRCNNTGQNEMIYEVKVGSDGRFAQTAQVITPESLREKHVSVKVRSNSFTDKFSESSVYTDTVVPLEFHTAPEAISSSGREMIFFKSGELCIMQKTHQGWKAIGDDIKLNIKEVWQADVSLASNGRAVLFTSHLTTDEDIHSGSGGHHEHANIFVCELDENGKWSKPIDLGPVINTMGCDRSPFLHPDMKTLYFCSDGHGGLGEYDMYVSTRLSDTCWTCWSEPVNLGKEYNTASDDWGFTISTDGSRAYFARDTNIPAKLRSKSRTGKYNRIHYVNLSPDIQPDKVATVSGKILDGKQKPVVGEIVWEDLSCGVEMGRSPINDENGEFFIVLPRGKNYGYYVLGNDIFPLSGNVDLRELNKFEKITVDYEVLSIKQMINEKKPMPLNNLFFDKGESVIQYESLCELNRIVQLLKSVNAKIEISGHSDNSGSDEFNQRLSQERADAVCDYLVKNGCNPDLIVSIGYGASKPVAPNNTEAGRKKNRRVEIRFL